MSQMMAMQMNIMQMQTAQQNPQNTSFNQTATTNVPVPVWITKHTSYLGTFDEMWTMFKTLKTDQ
jgi:hypothetical protein